MYVPEFRPTNQKMAIGFLIIIIVLVAVWCVMSRTGENPGKTDNDISGSVAELENRIDHAVQRGGRIQNILEDIERQNR